MQIQSGELIAFLLCLTEVFDRWYGGFKVHQLQMKKAELVARGQVVSSSFQLCRAFLSSVEDRKHFFDMVVLKTRSMKS